MGLRHVFLATVVIIGFGFGMVNVITDGLIVEELRSEFNLGTSFSSDPTIEVENVIMEQGEEKSIEVLVNNTNRISYHDYNSTTMRDNGITLETKPSPAPKMVQQSLPPYWNYETTVNQVRVNITFNASADAESGNYSYGFEAWNGDYTEKDPATENFTVQVLQS